MTPPKRRHFLSSFRPLIGTAAGRNAIAEYSLPGFIDGSCRREPDLESPFPSISALCRKAQFAPRLKEGDRVAYITVKGQYDGVSGWALVALLSIIKRFESHAEAAAWYRDRSLELPSNILVPDNKPEPLEHTSRTMPAGAREAFARTGDRHLAILKWDAAYQQRVRQHPTVLVTEPLYVDVQTPHVLTESDMRRIFGRVLWTRTPPVIQPAEFALLRRFAARAT